MKMRRASRNVATLVMALILVLVTGCIPAPGEITPAPTPTPTPEEVPTPAEITPAPTPGADQGIIEIRVTDPPPADVTSAVVYLTDIEVHKVSDNASEWIQVIGAPPSFDLMDVLNGVEEILGSAIVGAGKYTQIRMYVEKVEVEIAIDDTTVKITAEVPGEKLKIVRPFTVEAGVTTILTLDFDGEKSLVLPGKDIASGKERAIFKPVVKLLIEKEKGETEQEQEQEQEQEAEGLEFEGTIEAIDGTTWIMTIEGEDWTVDVSEAEIEGEPAVGLQAEVKGTVVDDTIVASEVEIEEEEEE